MIEKIIKRDGHAAVFDRNKIEAAIAKAASASETKLDVIIIANKAIKSVEMQTSTPSVEDVQNAVERALISFNFADCAKTYILYRERKAKEREGFKLVNVEKLVDDYISGVDWRIKENANTAYSVSGLMFHISGDIIAKYSLLKYTNKP